MAPVARQEVVAGGQDRREVDPARTPAGCPDHAVELRRRRPPGGLAPRRGGRHQADHADRPVALDEGRGRIAGLRGDRGVGLEDRLAGHHPAIEVVGFQRVGEAGSLGRVVGQQEERRIGRTAHPAGGIEARRNDERDGLEVHRRGRLAGRARSAARPVSGADLIRSSPIRAIARFSPRIGATSATVPIAASSASPRAASGPPGRPASRSWAILNATPLPARRGSG